jgi:hypothetical protein
LGAALMKSPALIGIGITRADRRCQGGIPNGAPSLA